MIFNRPKSVLFNSCVALVLGLALAGCGTTANGVVVLDLSDTGCGIDPRHRPHIFEPFYTTKAKGQGTGLGLAIAARIVEAHKGTIECHSTPGHGTRFHIELPAVVSSIDATESARSSDTSAIR